MSVPELDRFRAKYPQYGDIDDQTLATKLATKYPAYADLPGKVQAVGQSPQTPWQVLGNQRLGFLTPRLREMPHALASAADTAAFGLIPNQLYENLPRPEGLQSNIGSGLMQGAALFAGGPAQLATRATGLATRLAPRLAAKTLPAAIGRGAVSGGAFLGTSNLGEPRSILPNTALGIVGGGLLGAGVEGVGRGVQKYQAFRASAKLGKQLEDPAVREKAVREVQQSFLKTRPFQGKVTERFADRLAKKFPQRRVDFSEPIADAQAVGQTTPMFKTALESELKRQANSPRLQSIFNQPGAATDLTLSEARQVRQVIGKLYEKYGYRFGRPVDDLGLAVQESYHAFRAKELQAFPELERAYKAFSETAKRLKSLRGRLSDASMEGSIKSNFGENSLQIEVAKKLSRKGYAQAEKLRRAIRTRQNLRQFRSDVGKGALTGAVGAGAAGSAYGAYKLFQD